MPLSSPVALKAEVDRLFGQAAALMEGSPAEHDIAIQLLNQLALAVEVALTRRARRTGLRE
ncbi:MAG: hypothetical protein QM775_17820 [Pirellulales bacterium]